MRPFARAAALTAALSGVLTACGLAAFGTQTLAPDLAATHQRAEAIAAQTMAGSRVEALAPAAGAPEPAILQKVVVAPEPAVVPKPTLAAASVGPMKHIWQTLNNCGPAAVVMALSTLGVDASQETARLALRGPDERRGMGPAGVDPWVKELYGLRAIWRNNGTNALVKALLSNGFAPAVTQWMEDPTISRTAHWRTVAGYDDAQGLFYVNDSMRGRGVALSYEWFDENWQPFSYRYLVIYRPEDEKLLRAIVGDDWNERAMRQRYYERTRQEALDRRTSAAWLAYGEAAYQNGMFAEAVRAFEQGLALGSAQGVFTLRSSYPQALRALGREQEAAKVQQRVNGLTPAPTTVAPPPDPLIVQLALDRARGDGIRFSE